MKMWNREPRGKDNKKLLKTLLFKAFSVKHFARLTLSFSFINVLETLGLITHVPGGLMMLSPC